MPPLKNVVSHPSNLTLPNFEILFFELPNHFLHFNKSLGKKVPKLLVTYGICNVYLLLITFEWSNYSLIWWLYHICNISR